MFLERRLQLRDVGVPSELRAETVGGALDKIREAQKASPASELGKAYRQIRSSAPMTFSRESVEEAAEYFDDIVGRNWDHATNSRLLPQLRVTGEKIGDPALLPSGALQQEGIAPAAGELGAGAEARGVNIESISGISTVEGNIDTSYHYARLKGGYDAERSQQIIDETETLLREYDQLVAEGGETSERAIKISWQINAKLMKDFQLPSPSSYPLSVARRRLTEEKALLHQFKGYSEIEQHLAEEGFPLIISAKRELELIRCHGCIRGEALVKGKVSLADPEVVIFVERHKIPQVENYLREVLGIPNPRVRSLESFDVLSAVTDSYKHVLPDGTVLSPQEVRRRLLEDSDESFREMFRRELQDYAERMLQEERAVEAEQRALVGQAATWEANIINEDLVAGTLVGVN